MIIGNLQQQTLLEKKAEEYTNDVADSKKSFKIGLAVTAVGVGVMALACAFPSQVNQLVSMGTYGSWTRFGAEALSIAAFIAPFGIIKSITSKFELEDNKKDLNAILKEVEKEKNPLDTKFQIGNFTKIEPTKIEPTKIEPTKIEPTKIEPNEVLYKSKETKEELTIGKKSKIIALSLMGLGAALIGVYNIPESMNLIQSMGAATTDTFKFIMIAAPMVSAISFLTSLDYHGKKNLDKEKSEYNAAIPALDSDFKLATTDVVKNMQSLRNKTFSNDNNNLPTLKMS